MDVKLTGLQTNLAYLKELTTFTNINKNIRKHKNKPKHLWPLLLQLICNK